MATTLRAAITAHPTRSNLGAETRAVIAKILSRRLADAIDLQLQAKQAHWNVKGPGFVALHGLFDRVAVEVAQHVDLLAERAVQLGAVAKGVVQGVAERSELPRYPWWIASGEDHVIALANALGTFGAKILPGVAEAEQAGDPVTADILTEIARDIGKLRWMVEAHAQTQQ